MDGKDKIIERILFEANEKALETKRSADESYEKALASALEKAEAILKEGRAEIEKEREETLKRRKVVASLDGKKVILSAKTDAVDRVFKAVLDNLNSMEKSAYKSFIATLIEKNAKEGDVVVLAKNSPLSKEDLNSLPVFKERNLSLKLNGNFNGGIVLEGKISDVNLSFEAIVEEIKEKRQTAVAEELFGD